MTRFLIVLALVGGLAATLLAVAIWRGERSFGIARLWDRLTGPADLGPMRWDAILRSRTGNDALVCPPGLCGPAAVDRAPPVFAATGPSLEQAVAAVMAREPGMSLVATEGATRRYVARTPLLRFPDTVQVRVIDLGGGRSTLALHSRSKLGLGDMGANRARLERLLGEIERAMPVVQP
jgi:hypothetical protein